MSIPDISITCTSKNLSDKIKKEKKNGIQFAATPNEFRVVAVISHLFWSFFGIMSKAVELEPKSFL